MITDSQSMALESMQETLDRRESRLKAQAIEFLKTVPGYVEWVQLHGIYDHLPVPAHALYDYPLNVETAAEYIADNKLHGHAAGLRRLADKAEALQHANEALQWRYTQAKQRWKN